MSDTSTKELAELCAEAKQTADQKIAEFLEEAKKITQQCDFGGAPNKAMFWGHTQKPHPIFVGSLGEFYGRNNFLCSLYRNTSNVSCYSMDNTHGVKVIGKFMDKLSGMYPPEIADRAWDIFSKSFADSASGDRAFIAVNDMREGDYFERIELPIIRKKFSNVTTLEPAIGNNWGPSCKVTEWSFDEWYDAQQTQWQNHNHYLDRTPYPRELLPV